MPQISITKITLLFTLYCGLAYTHIVNAADKLAEERRAAYSAYEHKNYKLAYILLTKLAKQGDVYANLNLAHLLEAGEGTEKDIKRAIQHYKFAVENGVLDAANNLGAIYLAGVDGENTDELAVHYFQIAADKGNVDAQSNLAQLYLMGRGVERNTSLALKYFTRAALQNSVHSQYQLGVMYFKGDGVEQNNKEAYVWIVLAENNGYKLPDDVTNKLKGLLNSVQLREAELRITELTQKIKNTQAELR